MKPQTFPKLSLQKLSHDNIRMVLIRILNEWEKRPNIPPTIRILINRLTTSLETHKKIIIREQSCDLTKKIHELDTLRDRAYMLLARKIRNSQEEFDQPLIDAGAAMLPIIEKYSSDIVRLTFTEQTSQMLLAMAEFMKPEYAIHHETLNTTADLERANRFNIEFETVWNERSALDSNEEELPLMREVRQCMEQQLRLLLKVSEFLYNENHDSIDKVLYSVIENELSKMKTTQKLHESLAKNEGNSAS